MGNLGCRIQERHANVCLVNNVQGVEGGDEALEAGELQLLAVLGLGRPVPRGLEGVLALELVLLEGGGRDLRLSHQTVPAVGC